MSSSRMVTGEARFSYVHLLKPRESNLGGDPKFSVTILIPKNDMQTKHNIDMAIEAAKEYGRSNKWNGIVPPNVPTPLKDGDGSKDDGTAYGPECAGHWVLNASASQTDVIAIVDIQGQPIIDPSQIYSGMYGRIALNFSAYFAQGKKGIGCYISKNVQKTRDGEPLGSTAPAASEDFGTPAFPPNLQQAPMQQQYQAPTQQQYQAPAQQHQYQAPAQQQQYQAPVQQQYQAPAEQQYQAPVQNQYDPNQQYAQQQAPIYQNQQQNYTRTDADPFATGGGYIEVRDDELPF